MMLPPEAAELRPEQWPERTAIAPISTARTIIFFRDR